MSASAVFLTVRQASRTFGRQRALDDPASARRMLDLLRNLNRSDRLTVMVTLHQVDYALHCCDRVMALNAGRLVYDGPSAGLERAQLVEIYGPEFEDVFWDGAPQ